MTRDEPTRPDADQRSEVCTPAVEDEAYAIDDLIERVEGGEVLFWCEGCSDVIDEADTGVIRACTKCGDELFAQEENGRNCPTCNTPFTRREFERGCHACFEEVTEQVTAENAHEYA